MKLEYPVSKKTVEMAFIMTVCNGKSIEVAQFSTAVLARTFFEEEALNDWAKVNSRRWMKELWALRDDGFYGRIAFSITSLGWGEVKTPQEDTFARSYFIDWQGKTIDQEATQLFYAGYGLSARKIRAETEKEAEEEPTVTPVVLESVLYRMKEAIKD